MHWQDEIATSLQTAEQLRGALGLPDSALPQYERVIQRYPMRIPPYYFSLIRPSDPRDPIARMCVPSMEELDGSGSADTSGESVNTAQTGLQHKYRQTALVLASNTCAMYCRHCFRKRMVGLSDAELNTRVEEAVRYIRSHPEINNVLLTGGDALMIPNWTIRRYLEEFSDIDTLDFVRIGSRVPVVLPHRITEDRELLDLLENFRKRKALYLVTQFNHPREVTSEAAACLLALQERGVQVRNQTVLLRGVNDDSDTLGLLLRELALLHVSPYYVFQCRPAAGVKGRFQVPLQEGLRITEAAKAMQNGIGKSFRFAMSHPRGKIEILGQLDYGETLFKFHQSKDDADAGRVFTVALRPQDTWLDENLRGI